MKTFRLFVVAALFGLANQALADRGVQMEKWGTGQNNNLSATELVETGMGGGSGGTGVGLKTAILRGVTVMDESLRLATISSTVLYPGAAFTQFTFVFPNDVRKVKIQTVDGGTTNFCHVGWSASTTGSAPTAGTIEAYQHLPRVGGGGGALVLASQANPSNYEWNGIRTAGGFSTLYCGCTDTAAIGIRRIIVEYMRP